MAYEAGQPLKSGHLLAAEDLSAKQYHFVKLDTNGQIAAIGAGTDRTFGVLQNKPIAGDPCELVHIGFTKLVIGEAVAAAEALGTDADGKAVDDPTLKPAVALEAGSAEDVVIPALVNCAVFA